MIVTFPPPGHHDVLRDGTAGRDEMMKSSGTDVFLKRYLVFAVVGPLLSGVLLMLTSSVASGYWRKPDSSLLNFLIVTGRTLPISYMFGFLPAVLFAAVDDILWHVRWIGPMLRMVMIGAFAFVLTMVLSGTTGGSIELEYGLAGLVPAMLLSWWAHKKLDHAPDGEAAAGHPAA